MGPHLGKAGFRTAVIHQEGRKRHTVSQRAHRPTDVVVVHQHVVQRLEPSDLGQHPPRQRDGGPHAGLGQTDGDAQDHIGHEAVAHPHGREPGGEPRARHAPVVAGDRRPRRAGRRGGHAGQVVRPDGDVGVAEHQGFVPRRGQHVDQVGDLAVGAVDPRIDHQRDIGLGLVPAHRFHHFDGAISAILHPADQLD